MTIPNVPTTSSNDTQHRRQIAGAVNWLLNNETKEKHYPVGSIVLTLGGNPNELLDFGTWTCIGRLTAEPC